MMTTIARALAVYLAAWCIYVLASGEIFFNNPEATATVMAFVVLLVTLACASALSARTADLSLFTSLTVIVVISACAMNTWKMPSSPRGSAAAHAALDVDCGTSLLPRG